MEQYIRHIKQATITTLENEVNYLDGQIVSKTLSQNSSVSLTIFAFDKGEEISTHASSGDAMVTALDGVGEITIEDKKYTLKKGESIIMPAKKPHAVYAPERFKMFLTVIFPNSIDNGQWTMDNGQWTMDNGQFSGDR